MEKQLEQKLNDLHELVRALSLQVAKQQGKTYRTEAEIFKDEYKDDKNSEAIQALMQKTTEKFSCAGIPNIFDSNNHILVRFAWLVCILISFGLCIFYIVGSLVEFFSYSVVSSIRVFYKNEIIFPAFIICSWFSQFPIDQAILSCKFDNQDCHVTSYEKIPVLGYGLTDKRYCIRFNGKLTSPDETDSEKRLFTQKRNNVFSNGLTITFLIPKGIQIHYGVFENTHLIRAEEITSQATAGFGSFISVKKTVTDRLDEPFNQCTEMPEVATNPLVREVISMGSDYRQDFCFRICLLRYLETSCNCSLPEQFGLAHANTTDTCHRGCVRPIIDTFDFSLHCKCPLECDSVSYGLTESIREITKHRYFIDAVSVGLAKKNLSLEQAKDSLIAFCLNYETLSVTELTELPKVTVTNLVADLGGTIGVFLGLTVLSLVDIAEMTLRFGFILIKKASNYRK